MLNPRRTFAGQRGGGLIAALVTMLIFAIGLLGLVGALASAMAANDEARLRTDAAQLASALIADVWTTAETELDARYGAGAPSLRAWQGRVSARLPAATASLELAEATASITGRSALVTITWQRPGSAQRHRHMIAAHVGRNA